MLFMYIKLVIKKLSSCLAIRQTLLAFSFNKQGHCAINFKETASLLQQVCIIYEQTYNNIAQPRIHDRLLAVDLTMMSNKNTAKVYRHIYGHFVVYAIVGQYI